MPSPPRTPAPLVAALALLAICVCVGCNSHVVGTHDVAIDYSVTPEPAPKGSRFTPEEWTRVLLTDRLGAGQITADVEVKAGSARVTVDEDDAEAADQLLEWRGGLRLCRYDPAFVFSPGKLDGLTARTENGAAVERYFVGTADAVMRAVRATPVDAGHRMVVEPIGGGQVRTRAVLEPPLVDLTTGITGLSTSGKTLAVTLLQDKASAVTAAVGASTVAIVRDRAVLSTQPIAMTSNTFRIELGNDLYAYARAHRLKQVLGTANIPHVARTGIAALPANVPLAVAGIVLPMLLSFAWLFFVRRFDRAQPEPTWLILATFALGGLSVIPAGLAEYGFAALSPYLNPLLMSFGGQLWAFPIALPVFALTVGLSEEGSKFLGAWSLAGHRREFDEPVDGIVYGAASALGFAAVENVKYFALGRVGGALVASRAFMSVPAHLFFGAIWGYALGRKLVSPNKRVWPLFLAAALAHGAFDTLLSIQGLGLLAVLLNLGLATVFIDLLRRALRRGVVTAEAAAVPDERRALFAVGSRGAFVFAAVTLHFIAGMLFLAGVYVQSQHNRIGFGFLLVSSVLLGLLGLAAWGLSTAMPLDVAVDAFGVTFAGTAVPWRDITGVERRRLYGSPGGKQEIALRTRGGSLLLGPGSAPTMDALLQALAAGLAASAQGSAT